MKLKCLPEDFQVEEQIELPLAGGPFAVYELTKTSLGTLEAVGAIRQKWNLPPGAVQFAGLKDKHATTRQTVTIHQGPRRGLKQTQLELAYRGQAPRGVSSRDIRANRFHVVLRDLDAIGVARAEAAGDELARDGVPNYFDQQRFGSLGPSGEFVARPWCRGNYERALWLAIAETNPHDRPAERDARRRLREQWGQWDRCRPALGRSLLGEIAGHLAHRPGDFRGALSRLPHELRSLCLAAFQSDLWNALAAAAIEQHCRPEQLTRVRIARRELPVFHRLEEPQRELLRPLTLPLPSARLHLEPGPLKTLIDGVLANEGLALRELRIKYPRDTFFSKGDRPVLVRPEDWRLSSAADELHAGRQKLVLEFALPRGSYATLLVKRLTGAPSLGEMINDEC